MEVYLQNSKNYESTVTTDYTTAMELFKKHEKTATLITHNCSNSDGEKYFTYYSISWKQ